MKTEIEKKIEQLNKSQVPIVAIDPSLNKYQGKVLFPKKLALAEEHLKEWNCLKLRSTSANKCICNSMAAVCHQKQERKLIVS